MVINCLGLLWSRSVWESWQQLGADLPTTILAILNSCQSFGTVPMQRLASEIGKLRQFAQLFSAIPTLLVAIRHHATLPRAIFRNRQNGRAPPHCDALQLSENLFHLSVDKLGLLQTETDFVADSINSLKILGSVRLFGSLNHYKKIFLATKFFTWYLFLTG